MQIESGEKTEGLDKFNPKDQRLLSLDWVY